MKVETEHEEDGRRIAEVPELPGVMVYGTTREDAIMRVEALAQPLQTDGAGLGLSWGVNPNRSIDLIWGFQGFLEIDF
jgi:hypothetical protein